MAKTEKPINKVTTQILGVALRMCEIRYESNQYLDKIIDVIELIEEKGDQVSIMDICKLQVEWEPKF